MSIQSPSVDVGYITAVIILCTALSIRLLSRQQVRTLRLEMRWIWPALLALVAAPFIYDFEPAGTQWLYFGIALVVGGLLGWHSSALTPITINLQTHELDQPSSFLARLLFVLPVCFSRVAGDAASSLGLNGALVTELLLAFALSAASANQTEGVLRILRTLGPSYGD